MASWSRSAGDDESGEEAEGDRTFNGANREARLWSKEGGEGGGLTTVAKAHAAKAVAEREAANRALAEQAAPKRIAAERAVAEKAAADRAAMETAAAMEAEALPDSPVLKKLDEKLTRPLGDIVRCG